MRRPPIRRAGARDARSRWSAGSTGCGSPGCTQAPFTDRLVGKFELRVEGWRGRADPDALPRPAAGACVIEELRITDLGVISEAAIEPHPGLTVVTGETGAGKTMIVTGLGLLLGGRADPKARAYRCRRGCGSRAASSRRWRPGRSGHRRRRRAGSRPVGTRRAAGRAPSSRSSGRSQAYLGGAQVPAGLCADITADPRDHPRAVRTGPAQRRGSAAAAAGPVRRRAGTGARSPATARCGPKAEPPAPSWRSSAPRRRAGLRKPTCCASGWQRSKGWRLSRARMSHWPRRPYGCRPPTTSGLPRSRQCRPGRLR